MTQLRRAQPADKMASLLWPRQKTLEELLDILNGAEIAVSLQKATGATSADLLRTLAETASMGNLPR